MFYLSKKLKQPIDECAENGAVLVMMLDAFWNDPDLLYKFLKYARDKGVVVELVPNK